MRKYLVPAVTVAVLLGLAVPGQASVGARFQTASARVTAVPTGDITLLTGERVRLSAGSDGRPVVTTTKASTSGIAGASSTLMAGGDVYVIPAIARPYLGRFLDPALFDVSALNRAAESGRLAVHLTYSGSTVPVLPGVTILSASAGTASGYLTASSAKVFGAALARQYVADANAGWPKQDALFNRVGQLTGDAIPAEVATPTFPMRTLIIKVRDSAGAAVPFALVQMLSVDDSRKFNGLALVINGEARVSVPLGTYAGLTEVDSFDPVSLTGTLSMVPFDSYVVSNQAQTLTLDARTATSRLSVRTPRPADTVIESWEWDRTDGPGSGGAGASVSVPAGVDVRTAPVRVPAPSLGSLNSVASWALAAVPTRGLPYTYDLAFPSRGVPANQSHVVPSGDLATVTARYFSDAPAHPGYFGRFPVLSFQSFSGGVLLPLTVPQQRVEYVLAIPSAGWIALLLPNPDASADPFGNAIQDGVRLARAHTDTTVDWGKNPLVPGVPFATDGYPAGAFFCAACRTAVTLEVFLAPVTDTTPGHLGGVSVSPDGTAAITRIRLYRNGLLVSDQPNSFGGVFPVSAATASYRIVDDVDRSLSGALQSLTTQSELTFRSGAGQGGPLPHNWVCDLGPDCTLPDLMQAEVQLPVSLTGSAPIGASRISLMLGHVQGAPPAQIASAKVEVRIGSGRWETLPSTALGRGASSSP